ncbi:MAG: PAS domain-containing protein [Pseudomonadota bacterium]
MSNDSSPHLLKALERTKICVWRWSKSTRRIQFFPENPQGLFGLPPEQLPRSDEEVLARIHPDDRNRVAKVFWEAERESTGHEVEYRFFGPNKRTLYLREISQPEFDESGKFVGNFGTWHNLTEIREAEHERRESEKRLSLAVRIAGLGYWVWDEIDDKLIWCSAEFAKIIGMTDPSQAIDVFVSSDEHLRWVHVQDRSRYFAAVKNASEARTSYDIEYKFVNSGNELRYVREIGEPEFDVDGKHLRTRGTLQDVTERFLLLEELKKRESELKQAQRIGQIGHWILDLKAEQFSFWSDQLYRIFGVDSDTFNPSLEHFIAVIHPDDLKQSTEKREAALAEKRPYSFEYRIVRPDGKVRIIAGEARPEFDDEGEATRIFGVTQDVTDARQRDLALYQAQKMEAVGQLTGGVAHDFNNLLAVIQGNTELLMDKAGRHRSALQAIMRASESGAALIDSLLAFARQQPLRPRSISLADLFAGMLKLLERTLGEDVFVRADISSDLWPVLADNALLEASILNLAINARDAMPEGGRLTITCQEIVFSGSQSSGAEQDLAGDFIGIFVTDDGHGMPQAVKENAFNPFYTTKEVGQGSGLGLSMVYGFAKQSGGHVTIKSEPGQGTTVALYLPRAITPPPD